MSLYATVLAKHDISESKLFHQHWNSGWE